MPRYTGYEPLSVAPDLIEDTREPCGPQLFERRIAELEAALRAIFLAADNAGNEQEWADMVSAEMTDERRALVTD